MTEAVVKSCTCKNDGQDKLYGTQQRLFNQTQSGDYRCTVCGVSEGKKAKK